MFPHSLEPQAVLMPSAKHWKHTHKQHFIDRKKNRRIKTMSGYNGYTKSNNACHAEINGRYPLTHAKRIVSQATGLKLKESAAILEILHDGEWHHTSKFYNRVSYYCTKTAIMAVNEARGCGKNLMEFVQFCRDNTLISGGEWNYINAKNLNDAIQYEKIEAEFEALKGE